ncbi:hypothetical protein DL96DRAFT_1666394 [Flagelloscypha sp. PMI_526]|nr:hypothetical protein DL96DRAFT_1666394 [Flagelloscypha sp. PMI_526]
MDLAPEPDLHPLYPTTAQLALQLSLSAGLTPAQKNQLVAHALTRACIFADISVLQYLLVDPQAQSHVDLATKDEEQVGLVSLTIHGFGSDSERDVEREECVRLLIQQGADISADSTGWTPLHYAALLCPPTVVSHLITHGCSPFDKTNRGLTPLDIITAHTLLPGREDVAVLIEAAMRGDGWTGGRMEEKRQELELRLKRRGKRKSARDEVGRILGIPPKWWKTTVDSDDEPDEAEADNLTYTPPPDYASMLVFSPDDLDDIFSTIITNFPPTLRNSQPANTLYLLARFACLTCDHNWLEDLLLGATDAIEEAFFARSEDVTSLVFWLYNTTIWLHLMQCDTSINEACEMLVFIIRFAERKIDTLLDSCLLDHTPMPSEFHSVEFESDWSIFRPFISNKRKSNCAYVSPPNSPGQPTQRPSSPGPTAQNFPTSTSSGPFSSLRQSFARNRAGSSTPLQGMFEPVASPADITRFLSALNQLLNLSDINPALTTQLWSQIMYWTSCEMFNRILTRKKYIIGMNLSHIEEWVISMGLPCGVKAHFVPVRELLNWLQCLSSITEFPNLVATIQTLKHINPLQDYKYESILTQLQKDWERHRVKLGVQALRKEQSIRSVNTLGESSTANPQANIDSLFDPGSDRSSWEPVKPPPVLGELLDSRHMLPLVFPSDPRYLAVTPSRHAPEIDERQPPMSATIAPDSRSASRASSRNDASVISWRSRDRKIREVELSTLHRIGGTTRTRWAWRPTEFDEPDDEEGGELSGDDDLEDQDAKDETLRVQMHFTPVRRVSRKGRASHGGDVTPIEEDVP